MGSEIIRLTEVGPRDGLQNEKDLIPTEAKVRFIDALSRTGAQEIEAGAFVSPQAIPQLADSEEVFKAIRRDPDVVYSALVPNEQGLDRALAAKVNKIAVFTAASESFNQKNIRASIAESIERFRPVVRRAKTAGLPVRGYVSTAFHCPFEGKIRPEKVLDVLNELGSLGVDEFSVGDTTGRAQPNEVRRLLDLILKEYAPQHIVMHFHDTYEQAIVNALTAWKEYDISGFDASAGGVGGCPYAPGASGNVSSESLLAGLKASGASIPADPSSFSKAFETIRPYIHARPQAA